MKWLAKIGSPAVQWWRVIHQFSSVICGLIYMSVHRRYYPVTVREQIARQILFTGVEAVRIIFLIALLAGITVVVQAQLWLGRVGQSEMLGPLLVAVIIREVGPLLVNLVVIARSGTAITTELASMRVRGEVHSLDAMGIDPMVYLVMPRVFGVVLSVLCLTVLFVAISFGSGYLLSVPLGVRPGDPALFLNSVLGALFPSDILNFLAKTMVSGIITGTVCCVEGLSIHGSVTEVPQAATRAVVRSIIFVIVISAMISMLAYV